MTPAAIEVEVRKIVQRLGPSLRDGFSASADLYRELGVKSIAALDLLLSLEEGFGVSIDDAAFGDARSVEQIVAMIGGLLSGKSEG